VPSATTYTSTLTQAVLTVYSKEIMFYAQPILRYAQFAVKKTELGTTPGLKIVFMRYNNLTAGAKLTENVAMTTQALTASQIELAVAEYGNAISVSELLLQSSFDDVLASGARLLGMDYAEVVDVMFRDTLLTATSAYTLSVAYAGGATTRNGLDGTKVFDSALIKDAVEVLETKKVRKWNGDAYVCFIHPHQARHLKDDPDFKLAKDYGGIYAGEIGRVDDIVFISTTQQPTVKNAADKDVYKSVIFGDNAYGWAEGLPVEMRDGGIKDFGRQHDLAWYSIMGAGVIEGDNILVLETN
jgi:N4-gp56 family major capsid protein